MKTVKIAATCIAICMFISCVADGGVKNNDKSRRGTKNIVDYFNILSEQNIVRGKIVLKNGKYIMEMDDCYSSGYPVINIAKNVINYEYSNPCSGPPPTYVVFAAMAISNAEDIYMYIFSRERNFGDEESCYYKFNGRVFIKVEKKVLPAEIFAMFK